MPVGRAKIIEAAEEEEEHETVCFSQFILLLFKIMIIIIKKKLLTIPKKKKKKKKKKKHQIKDQFETLTKSLASTSRLLNRLHNKMDTALASSSLDFEAELDVSSLFFFFPSPLSLLLSPCFLTSFPFLSLSSLSFSPPLLLPPLSFFFFFFHFFFSLFNRDFLVTNLREKPLLTTL